MQIAELADVAKVPEFGLTHIRSGTSLSDFRAALLEKLVEMEAPIVDSTILTEIGGNQQRDQQRATAMAAAILHRVDPANHPLTPDVRAFRGQTLLDMGREILEANGIRTRGMNRQEIAGEALVKRGGGMHSTSDFPAILGNVINTTLRAGYQAAGQTFRPLVRQVTVPDFKAVHRAQIGEAPRLEKVNEHGEFTRGTMTEGKESYRIATYGKVIGLTRQAIINDDLSAFGRIPQMFGVQAAQLESDLVWSEILGNPTMGDGTALFHLASHKNLQGAAALGVAPIGTMRTAMAKQTGLDGKTVLNIRPEFLIVPVDLEIAAEQLFKALLYPATAADATPESVRRLTIISEPRLDNGLINPATGGSIAGSSTAYYLAASPAFIDTVELAYLEGAEGLYTETRMGYDVDGLEIKVRLDAGAKVIDWRGFQKNPGA